MTSGSSTPAAPGAITVVTVKGIKVAVVGFAPYSWAQSLTDLDAAADLVEKAKGLADLVVVQAHVGAEGRDKQHVTPGTEIFLGENRGDSYHFARRVIDAGADVVIMHGPHVMRGLEFYKGHLIAYSLGNFAGYKSLSTQGNSGLSGILKVTLRRDGSFVSGQHGPGDRGATRRAPAGPAETLDHFPVEPVKAGLRQDGGRDQQGREDQPTNVVAETIPAAAANSAARGPLTSLAAMAGSVGPVP